MSLVELQIDIETVGLPDDVVAFLNEADKRHELFLAARGKNPVHGFHPSDFPLVYHSLAAIRRLHLAAGDRFCEWGSGFGVVASLAAMLGFEAYGIEINEQLYQASQSLASDFDVPVEFACGSFIPGDFDAMPEANNDFFWLDNSGDDGYEILDLDAEDFDVIFAYPWPDEASVLLDLFETVAARGAIFLTYHGVNEIHVHRKSGRSR